MVGWEQTETVLQFDYLYKILKNSPNKWAIIISYLKKQIGYKAYFDLFTWMKMSVDA